MTGVEIAQTSQFDPSLPKFGLIAAVGQGLELGHNNDLPWINQPIPTDMNYYEKVTSYFRFDKLFDSPNQINEDLNIVIMGRKTWDSLPFTFRPFKNRFNIVVSRNKDFKLEFKNESLRDKVFLVNSLDEGLRLAKKLTLTGSIFVVGGSFLYSEALVHPNCHHMLITELFDHEPFLADIKFPTYKDLPINGLNTTDLAVKWLNQFPPSKKLPVAAFDTLGQDEFGPYVLENGVKFRFSIYTRNNPIN